MTVPDRTHYEVLGITPDANAAAVRAAWKLHVQAWHPDRFSGAQREDAQKQTQLINEAYTVLRDAGRRAAYDCVQAASRQQDTQKPQPAQTKQRAAASTLEATRSQQGLAEDVNAAISQAWKTAKRHPRTFSAVAATWALIMGVSVVMSIGAGPATPAYSVDSAQHRNSTLTSREQTEQLENLVDRAKAEAALEDQQLQQMMREDERREQAELAQLHRAEQSAARFRKQRPIRKNERRILRILPAVR